MNSSWVSYLQSVGAQTNEAGQTTFPESYDTQQTHLFDLSYRAIIKISGNDAQSFLHGQFSNDLNSLDGSNSQISSYSNPKGRLLSIFRITRVEDFYLMSFPGDIKDAITKRLQMFVMRADVHLEDVSESWVVSGLGGENASEILDSKNLGPASGVDSCHWNAGLQTLTIRVAGEQDRFEIYAPTDQMQSLWSDVAGQAVPASTNYWKLLQIRAGLADIYQSTQEEFVAQMVNLQITGAVNFKKGCYPGQEIVARLQYLGKLKRKMYRYKIEGGNLPQPGTEITLVDSGDTSGTVVDAAIAPEGTVEMLIVLKVADVDAVKALQVSVDDENYVLQQMSLPYSLDD